jgi:Zn-dependent protease
VSSIVNILLPFALIIPAIVFHEVAHGYAALALGDTTAKDQGRLSLNPLKHIDPFGTVLLPLLMFAMAGVGFGYAKPVPVNPNRFTGDVRKGMFLTGIAGPTANLAMAVVGGVLVRLFGTADGVLSWIAVGAYLFANVNLVLLFFNLIPLPPLDGSRVLPLFLSDRAMRTYVQWERYGFLIPFGVLWLAPRFLGFDPIGAYFDVTVYPLLTLLTGVS